ASGEYERIYARWLRADRSAGWLKWIAGALLVAIGGLAVVAAWNHDLRRRVAIQTDALRREFEDRERAQAALAESERSLRAAQKLEALGRMAGGIAHDFNNVLSVVSSSGTALRDELVARGESTEDVDEILSAVERASRLVKQLLAFGRATPLALARLDLGEVVLGMKSLIQRLTGDRVRVEVEVPDAPVFVDAETSFVEQVLLNLAANARDAMSGSGTLEVRLGTRTVREGEHPGLPAGAYASLTVSDTGVGMDEATASRVFEPFFTTKPVGRGTGLGLSTVFAVVSRMNGRVTVESAPGCGTTFEVLLPLAAPEGVGDRGGAASRAEVPVAPAQDILLVEDDDSLRRAAAVALRRAGHRVQEAGDGASALALAAKHAPTLVVSDVVLPGRTGPSVVAELRARNPGLPVLFTSGYVQEGVELPLDAPGTAFLAKPYSGPVLVEAVRRLLSRDTAPAANA
ncbi:MAG TPA: ATP-binding protein, partial [Anaeromyxobacteraceae bacterium]|nr:ATP-binding protein [Anaeromyxobacteraceae bacterium]